MLLGQEEKQILLSSITKFKKRFCFKLYAIVVMDNHLHLVLECGPARNISQIMQAILLSFSVKYRRRYDYTGYVWEGRFKSQIIDNERYLKEAIDYVHANPVRANIVKTAQEYFWSSYGSYHGLTNTVVDHLIDRFER